MIYRDPINSSKVTVKVLIVFLENVKPRLSSPCYPPVGDWPRPPLSPSCTLEGARRSEAAGGRRLLRTRAAPGWECPGTW